MITDFVIENQGPHVGHADFQVPGDICSSSMEYVVVRYDAYPNEIFSGVFGIEGEC